MSILYPRKLEMIELELTQTDKFFSTLKKDGH